MVASPITDVVLSCGRSRHQELSNRVELANASAMQQRLLLKTADSHFWRMYLAANALIQGH